MINLFQKLADYILPYPASGTGNFEAEKPALQEIIPDELDKIFDLEMADQEDPIKEIVQESSGEAIPDFSSAVNQDLLQLLDLGEHRKAWQLSKKHNYFNIHPVLALTFSQVGDYKSAVEVMEELISGPLANVLTQALADDSSEFFFLPRTVYLLDYAAKQWQEPGIVFDLSGALMDRWRSRPSFAVFLDRLHGQMARLTDDKRQQYLQSQLEKHLILNLEKIQEIYDLDNQPLSIDFQIFQSNAFADDYFAVRKPLLAQTIRPGAPEAEDSNAWVLFNQARQNIQEYLATRKPNNYLQTQAKMDLLAVSDKLNPEAIYSLTRRLGVVDFYPYVSYLWQQQNDHSHALAAAQDFIHQSEIFATGHGFQDEIFKEHFLGFLAEVLRQSPDGSLHAVIRTCGDQMAGQYQEKLHHLVSSDSQAVDYLETALMPLISSQKIIFNLKN